MNKREQIKNIILKRLPHDLLDTAVEEILALDEPKPDPLIPTEKDIGKLCEFSDDGESWVHGDLSFIKRGEAHPYHMVLGAWFPHCRLYPHIHLHPWDSDEAPPDWKGGMVIYASCGFLNKREGNSHVNWPRVRWYTTAEELAAAGIDGWGGES